MSKRCALRRLGGGILLAAIGAAPHVRAEAPPGGMDPDGRIPAIEKPADLEHPERWRFMPEARLKEGSMLDRFLVSTFIVPLFSSDSDVGTGGGIGVFDMDFRGSRRRERAGGFASYTTEGEQRYGVFWRRLLRHREVPGGVIFEERSFVDLDLDYRRSLTERFFGLGEDSEADDETSYTDESISFAARLDLALPGRFDDLVASVVLRGETHSLSRGRIEDRPSAEDLFPDVIEAADDNDLLWIGLGLSWDTRDSPVQPLTGFELGGRVEGTVHQSNGDLGARWSLRGSRIFALPPLIHDGGQGAEEHPPTDTLALGLRTEGVIGDLPFLALPALGGGELHRGFVGGRFRGEAAWLGVLEYRLWLLPRGVAFTEEIRVERIGIAPFYEVGIVADRWRELFSAAPAHSYGLGLRFSIDRDALLRFDLGFSEDGSNFAVQFGYSF